MRGYHTLQLRRAGIYTPCARGSNSQCGLVSQSTEQLIMVHILRKRPHYCNGQWKLHYNNVCPHVAQHVWEVLYLTWCGSDSSILSTPYSPDLAPCDIFLFPKDKRDLKGCHFEFAQVRGCRNCFQTFDVKWISMCV